jgi:hypothetical protein
MEGLGILILIGLFVFYPIVLPILVFTARGRINRLEAEARALREEIANLKTRTAGAAPPQPAASVAAPATPPSPSRPPTPETAVSTLTPAPSVAREAAAPPAAAPPTAAVPPIPPSPPLPPLPERAGSTLTPAPSIARESAAPPATSTPAGAPAAPAPPAAVPSGAPPRPARPPVPPAARPPVPPAERPAAAPFSGPPAPPAGAPPRGPRPPQVPASAGGGGLSSFNWESLVGVKLFSAIAGIALLLAAVFFLRFSVEHGWLQPPVRVAIGVIVAIALLVTCELRAADKYRVTANALDASGIAILFSTFFAAHALWNLIPAWLTFLLLVIVTAVAVLLSIRRASVFIAVLGLLGGFAAPAMLSSGQNNPLGLFGYLLLLNAGLAWVAHTKRWPIITTLSLIFTTIYQWGWVAKFLDSASLPMAAGVFLVFPLLTLFMTTLSERFRGASDATAAGAGGNAISRTFGNTPGVSAMMPFLLALYLAMVPQYGQHYGILFGFLFLIDIGLFVVATMRRAPVLQVVSGATTLMVFTIWFGLSYNAAAAAWPIVLGILAVFVVLFLVMPIAADWFDRPFEGIAAYSVYTAPLLLAACPALIVMEPLAAKPFLLFGVLALLLIANAAFAIASASADEDGGSISSGGVYFVAAAFAILSELFWSSRYLTPGRLYSALTIYFLFAIIFIAVPAIARRFDRDLQPRLASSGLVIFSLVLAFFLTGPNIAHGSLWGLAALIGLIMAALSYEAREAKFGWLAPIGGVFAWMLLWMWWAVGVHGTADRTMMLPTLAVITGLSLLMMGIAVWLRPHTHGAGGGTGAGAPASMLTGAATPADANLVLGLIGHFFLFVIAASPVLSMPPWPIFAVLFVLDLALFAVVLHQRRGELQIAGMLASAVVLFTWTLHVDPMPYSLVAMLVALTLPAYAIVTTLVAARVSYVLKSFLIATVIAVVGGQLMMISAGAANEPPNVLLLIASNVVLLGTLLALAARDGWSRLVWLPLATTTLMMLAWSASPGLKNDWSVQLALPAAIYACFLAFPIIMGRRVGGGINAHRAAVLASVPVFFHARHAMLMGGFSSIIGALAVVQALCMLGLLLQLLRLDPPGRRALGRLALVAGAALAFVTLAIPLQLDKQWLTVAWALEGAALAWLYGRIPHRGLLLSCGALLAVVFVRLALNPSVFAYAPRSEVRIFNWYLYAYLISAVSCFVAAWLLTRTDDTLLDTMPRVSNVLWTLGTVLLFLLLNIEIADFYATGPTLTFRFSATLAQDLTYTLGWGTFAIGLLIVGIRGRIRNARLASIGLLLVTVFKCFLHDLGRLGGLYLVASFVGLAICLALVALALQKFVLAAEPKDAEDAV